jgi:hypothetical protein
MIHATEDLFSPTEGNFQHTGIFSGRVPIPTDGIFPQCRNFSDHIPNPKAGIYFLLLNYLLALGRAYNIFKGFSLITL